MSSELTPDQRRAWEKRRAWSDKTGLTAVTVQLRAGDIELRHKLELNLYRVLQSPGLGCCVAGQSGSETAEIVLHVRTSVLSESLPLVKQVLEESEALAGSRIDLPDYEAFVMRNYHPQTGAPFDFFAGAKRSAEVIKITAAFRSEVRSGENAVESDIGSQMPSAVVPLLLQIHESQKNASSGFKLGFAVGGMRRMSNYARFKSDLTPDERQHANTGWTIYSSQALYSQLELRLTNEQMVELFGPSIVEQLKGNRPFP